MENYMQRLLEDILNRCNSLQKIETQIAFTNKAIEDKRHEIVLIKKDIARLGADFKESFGRLQKPLSEILEIHETIQDFNEQLLSILNSKKKP